MASPYVTTRSGSAQWIMQRVSAVLLLVLAFSHFALQHYTAAEVSTGLTVSARFNNPWWQAYYIIFVVLVLYHGVNGLVGILRDYNPHTLLQLILESVLWSLTAIFAIRGVVNIASPRSLDSVKDLYAANGLPAGESLGSPPGPAGTYRYDFRGEGAELRMLAYYLTYHTSRTEPHPLPAGDIFSGPATVQAAHAPPHIRDQATAFDTWARARIAEGPVVVDRRDRSRIFSSTYEFAVWAEHVRAADARARRDRSDRVPFDLPPFNAIQLH